MVDTKYRCTFKTCKHPDREIASSDTVVFDVVSGTRRAMHHDCRPAPVLKLHDRVTVATDGGGVFVGIVGSFESDGNVAVIMPVREPVRDVFPKGYTLGRAHWPARIIEVAG